MRENKRLMSIKGGDNDVEDDGDGDNYDDGDAGNDPGFEAD